ncbi:acyltransferase ChoActase/COT/CPT [Auriculariales sp. MPI-PUGE-AT-0066]|nr:acyltransferase ChoActase/COT/CPT [Auriculariales sp. MPI-PUGE-AT-0066]
MRFAPKIVTVNNDVYRADWKQAAPAPPAETTTLAHQDKLPKLPLLPLKPTLDRLKESLKPLAWSEYEYATTVRKIDEFGKPGAIGSTLQARLEQHASNKRHWLETWWDDGAYLTYRDSVVVNVSYYYGFDEHPAHLPQRSTHRAAAIARAALLFRRQLKQGQLTPDATKEGAICMDTFRWMFDCCRIPGREGNDWSHSYSELNDGNRGHIIIIRRNSVWKVNIAPDGTLLSVGQLEHLIDHIKRRSGEREWPEVGVLVANDRDSWAEDYAKLIKNYKNRTIVRDIHSAAFVMCLDEGGPDSAVEYSRALWHGGRGGRALANRWVDKPVQFVVYDNMKAGIMGEHSVMDGTPTVRLCDDVLNMIAAPDFDTGDTHDSRFARAPDVVSRATESPLKELIAGTTENVRWVIDADLKQRVQQANDALAKLCDDQELGFHRTPYGKQQIKKFGFSPDGWAQMIVQLAYSRLLRKHPKLQADGILPGGTYEAASTRKFFKGRTEAIRVTSTDSRAWVAAMEDGSTTPETRRELFAQALNRHGADARAAGNGQGVDRHIFGLKKSVEKDDTPVELFSDPLFQRGSNWVLSTSAIFSPHFEVYGWGEVVPNGFGVAYMTGFDGECDYLQYTITSRVEMPNKDFVDAIARAAVELRDLFASAPSSKAKL